MLDATTYRKIFSRLGFCFFAMLAITYLGQSAFSILISHLIPNAVQADWYAWLISYIPLYGLAVPLFFLLLRKLLPQNSPAPVQNDLNAVQALAYVVLSLGTLYGFNLLTVAVTALFDASILNPVAEIQQASGTLWTFLCGCLLAPIGEELIFRRAIYQKLGALGDKAYILSSGIIFGLFHGNVSQLFYAAAIGMVFAYLYARTGRIIYPILLHIVVNMLGMMVAPMLLEHPLLLGLFGMGMMACIAGAIALLILNRRRLQFTPPPVALPAHPVRRALLAPGLLFYLLLSVATVVCVLLAPLWLGGAA